MVQQQQPQQRRRRRQEDLACRATVSSSSGAAQRPVEKSGLQVQMQALSKTAMLQCGMARHTLAMNCTQHMQHWVLQMLQRWRITCKTVAQMVLE
jgi:hypothetical protein